MGNIRQINDALFAPTDGRHNTQSYTYDGLYRMIGSAGPQLGTCSYGYDPIGNITKKCGLIYTYSTAKPHRLVSTSGAASMSFTDDANGNLLTKSGTLAYSNTYDFDDRLETITVGTLTVTNTYDYSGRRVMKNSAAGTVRYFGDLVEVEGGILRRHYFALGARVASREQGTTASLLFYHADHLGSPQVLTDSLGNVVEYIRTAPYGEIRGLFDSNGVPLPGAPRSRYVFTDQERDPETNLLYFGARFYDPQIALFLSFDPQAQWDSPYSYAGWNPVNLVDPDGEFALGGILDGIGAFFGGLWSIIRGVFSGISIEGAHSDGLGSSHLPPWLTPPSPPGGPPPGGGCFFCLPPSPGPAIPEVDIQDLLNQGVMVAAVHLPCGDCGMTPEQANDAMMGIFPGGLATSAGKEAVERGGSRFINWFTRLARRIFPAKAIPRSLGAAARKASEFTTNAKQAMNRLGLTKEQFRRAIHDIKSKAEGNPDMKFDLTTGDVFDQRSNEHIGNLLDYLD